MNVDRRTWRDAIRAPDGPLTANARHVALTMADYWPKDGATLWCSVQTVTGHTALSSRTVYRALGELRAGGYLVQVEAATHNTSPRYRATMPRAATQSSQGCHTVTPGVTDRQPTPEEPHKDSTDGQAEADSGPPGGRTADAARETTRIRPPRQRARKPLTAEARQASWQRFRVMDLGDLADDINTRGAAFVELEKHHGVVEPDKWAAQLIERGEWAGFCSSFALGSHLTATFSRSA